MMPRALIAVLLLWPAVAAFAGEEPDTLVLGPERVDAGLALAHRAPAGVDPGASTPAGPFGEALLSFFFRAGEGGPLRVRFETYPGFEDLDALVRTRRGARDPGQGPPGEPFEGGGFERGLALRWPPDGGGRAAVELFLKAGRRLTVATFTFEAKDRDLYASTLQAMIASLRSTAVDAGGIPVPAGARAERHADFEIVTEAEKDLVSAVVQLLDAALSGIRERCPVPRAPEYPRLVRLFATSEAFARFREEQRADASLGALFFEDARVVVLGPLAQGKSSRRFSRWELDAEQTVRCLLEQHLLHGLGTRPEPWLVEGAALSLGLAFGPDLKFAKTRAEDEIALAVEEALASRAAPAPADLFAAPRLDEAARWQAASWVHFFFHGPGQGRKEVVPKLLAAFARTWDGPAARQEALGGADLAALARNHSRYFLYAAQRAKRTR